VGVGNVFISFFERQQDAAEVADRYMRVIPSSIFYEVKTHHGFLVQNIETGAYADALGFVASGIVDLVLKQPPFLPKPVKRRSSSSWRNN
jgi:hypothetical protein